LKKSKKFKIYSKTKNQNADKAETHEVFPPNSIIFMVSCQQQPCKLFLLPAGTKNFTTPLLTKLAWCELCCLNPGEMLFDFAVVDPQEFSETCNHINEKLLLLRLFLLHETVNIIIRLGAEHIEQNQIQGSPQVGRAAFGDRIALLVNHSRLISRRVCASKPGKRLFAVKTVNITDFGDELGGESFADT